MNITLFTILLVEGVIFVNGLTDAPGAITGIVASGAMSYKKAVRLAAVANLFGVLVTTFFMSSVAQTVASLVDFSADDPGRSLAALLCALVTIIIFAVGAWFFGIPTSESHALLSALMGAGIAANGLSAVDGPALFKVLFGMVFSIAIGFAAGFAAHKFYGVRRLSFAKIRSRQTFWAAAAAFMHGAQDGQKFVAVFIMAEMLSKGIYAVGAPEMRDYVLVTLLCAFTMALGSSAGGKKIVDNLGSMTRPDSSSALAASAGGSLCMLAATLFGLPISTTHSSTSALAGASYARDSASIDRSLFGEMLAAWTVTFPVCMLLGYLFTRIAHGFLI